MSQHYSDPGRAGIDYGLGQTNIDRATGIRYGCISSHTVGEAWYDDAEADYGDPTCPECGNDAVSADTLTEDQAEAFESLSKYECADYACLSCERVFGSESAFGEEPLGYSYDAQGYKLTSCLDSDIMVLLSPYYTFAQFCSPCVPGAGSLENPCVDGPKTYCLGPEWFEDDQAPYAVYSVETNELIQAEPDDDNSATEDNS